MMNYHATWLANKESYITIIGGRDVTIKAYYRQRGSAVAFQEFSEEFLWRGQDTWELTTTLPIGEYIVKLIIDNVPEYMIIKVLDSGKYETVVTNDLIREQLTKLINNMLETNNDKIVG